MRERRRRLGKTMEDLKKIRVKLTRDLVSDEDVEARLGASAKRKSSFFG